MGMPSMHTNNFPKSGRGLGHVTATIFGSTVGYPSDSLASCSDKQRDTVMQNTIQNKCSYSSTDVKVHCIALQSTACVMCAVQTMHADF